MKKIFLTAGLALIAAAGSLRAQDYKVIESSSKKMPIWVHSQQTDYIVVSAIGADIESLKDECLRGVRRQMIQAVAENVSFGSSNVISQESMNNEIVSFMDNYTSTYETQAASVPFLKGVSMSKVEETYWEKRRDKGSKEISYLYAIKYPFPAKELKSLVYEFEKRDKEMYRKLTDLEEAYGSVSSVEQIDRAVSDLGPLIAYFFDDVRKGAAKNLQANYKKLYSNIMFQTISNKVGKHVFALLLDGREITTSQRPSLTSTEASQLQMNSEGSHYAVTYDYSGSEYDAENSVSVRFMFGGKPVTHKFYYTVTRQRVDVEPHGTAYLTANTVEGDSLRDIALRMDIVSKYPQFTVKSLTLDVPGLGQPLFLDNMSLTLTGEQTTLQATYAGPVRVIEKLNNRLGSLKGTMEVAIPDQSGVKKVYFNVTFRPNW